MSDRLSAVFTGLERKREIRFEIVYRQQLGVLELEPLGSVRRNRRDLNCERGRVSVFALLLQQSGIDRLQREILVDLFGSALLEDHAGNAHVSVPNGKV